MHTDTPVTEILGPFACAVAKVCVRLHTPARSLSSEVWEQLIVGAFRKTHLGDRGLFVRAFMSFTWRGGASRAKETAQQQSGGLTRHVTVLACGVAGMAACSSSGMGPVGHAEDFGEPRSRQGCGQVGVFSRYSGCSLERKLERTWLWPSLFWTAQ